MTPLTILSLITMVVGLIGIAFTIWNKVTKPQEILDKEHAVDQVLSSGQTALFNERFKWEKDANDKRFSEVGARMSESMTLAQNHIHTVDTKVDALISLVNEMGKGIVRLETIINERIPQK